MLPPRVHHIYNTYEALCARGLDKQMGDQAALICTDYDKQMDDKACIFNMHGFNLVYYINLTRGPGHGGRHQSRMRGPPPWRGFGVAPTTYDAPRSAQEASKTLLGRTKTPPRRLKMPSRRLKMPPRRFWEHP